MESAKGFYFSSSQEQHQRHLHGLLLPPPPPPPPHALWSPVGAPMSSTSSGSNLIPHGDHFNNANANNDSNYDQRWRHDFDDSVNAVSFGFVATAILISMFLVMAIFERFLRTSTSPELSPSGRRSHGDIESQMGFHGKLNYPSPKMTVYANGVSVLMPGDHVPTYIAHPAPMPCPPERIVRSHHQHISFPVPASSSNQSTERTNLSMARIN